MDCEAGHLNLIGLLRAGGQLLRLPCSKAEVVAVQKLLGLCNGAAGGWQLLSCLACCGDGCSPSAVLVASAA